MIVCSIPARVCPRLKMPHLEVACLALQIHRLGYPDGAWHGGCVYQDLKGLYNMLITTSQVFLTPLEPLQPPHLPLTSVPYIESLRSSRAEYKRLILKELRAPDGSYEDGFIAPGIDVPPRRSGVDSSNLDRNNPLSLHDEVGTIFIPQNHVLIFVQNPWKEWFSAVDLRKTIRQDVERT